MDPETQGLVRRLLDRLERISVDSIWAHRASGVRGSLLRLLEAGPSDGRPGSSTMATQVIDLAHHILEAAARERLR